MPFGTATKLTNKGAALHADRARSSPGTYTAPPKFIAIGTGATGAGRTAAITDTALTTEAETRATGTESTITTTVTGDTYQTSGTITMTGTRAIDEIGTFDVVTSSSGNMIVSATVNVISLNSGDQLTVTAKTQITTS